MKVGLVGFAGSGKTTVFNAMTALAVPVGFGGTVRLGMVKVPDERIDRLAEVFSPKKTTYAEISFCDVPGEYGAEKKGLSPKALQQIRDQDALCLVLRDFVNPTLEGDPDPLADLEAFHTECVFADLDIVERRFYRARKDGISVLELGAFETMKEVLEQQRPVRSLSPAELNRDHFLGYGMLTGRPLLVALNRGERAASEELPAEIATALAAIHAAGLVLSAGVEAEIASLEAADQAAFFEDLGHAESALARFIRSAYGLLDLVSFFTVGADEVRAWTIKRGTGARQAAGRIHSDLERGFIRAEVIPFGVFMEHGSELAVKNAGLLRVEGKDYVVCDGDILHVLFNV